MTRSSIAESRVFASWQDNQDALVHVVASLSDAQLQSRPLAGQRTPGEVVEQIASDRAHWLLELVAEETERIAPILQWGSAGAPPRTAAEIVAGLEFTWRLIVANLMQGDANADVTDWQARALQRFWGMLERDLTQAGELSLLLRVMRLPGA